jgi:tetratricopeptide (TPR) repeat protein
MRLISKLVPVLCLLTLSLGARAEENKEAAAAYDHGVAVLVTGDFDGAIGAFKEAAKADPENESYRKELALVSRVKALRGVLPKVYDDAAKWEKMASSLRSYYLQHEIFGEAVAIDELRNKRFATPATAIDLAESYLEKYDDAKAVRALESVEAKDRTVRANVMLGIGLARTDQLDAAKKLAATAGRGEEADAQLLYDRACLNALVGDLPLAAEQLTACFEQVPASSLVTLKRYSKTRRDLAGLKAPAFASVWKTESKVKSGGCAGCSSAGTCGEKDEDGGCKDGDDCDDDKKDCDDKN